MKLTKLALLAYLHKLKIDNPINSILLSMQASNTYSDVTIKYSIRLFNSDELYSLQPALFKKYNYEDKQAKKYNASPYTFYNKLRRDLTLKPGTQTHYDNIKHRRVENKGLNRKTTLLLTKQEAIELLNSYSSDNNQIVDDTSLLFERLAMAKVDILAKSKPINCNGII